MTYDNFISKIHALFDEDDELEKLRKEIDELKADYDKVLDQMSDITAELEGRGYEISDLSDILDKADQNDDMVQDFEEIHNICNNWR